MAMKPRLIIIIIVFLLIGVFTKGCAGNRNKDVLARINGKETITLSEFNDRISKLPPQFQEIINKNKKEFLEELIVDRLLYDEAVLRKLDGKKDVKELFNEAKRKILMARLLKQEVEDSVAVGEEDIENYYNANKDMFTTPETLRASHILVKTEKDANDVMVELANGRNFEDLARSRSLDPTSDIGGDIGYFTRNQLVPEIEEACFKMQPGEVSGIVKTRFGYHVIKLTERVEPRVRDISEVRDSVEGSLKRLKKKILFNEFVERLRGKSQITVNHELLKAVSDNDDSVEKPDF